MTLPHTERKKEREVAQLCPTLCDPMDSSLHQAPPSMGFSRQEVLEWVAISFSRESSQPRDQTCVSRIAGGFSPDSSRNDPSRHLWAQSPL